MTLTQLELLAINIRELSDLDTGLIKFHHLGLRTGVTYVPMRESELRQPQRRVPRDRNC